ncbi:MAG: phosphate acyltransferase PlsX [Eubacteriales bacterium]
MKIIIDAMGGDNAPGEIVKGAFRAADELGVKVILVGQGDAILEAMGKNGVDTLPKGVEIAHADDVVDMHDDPTSVVKKRKDSSMIVGLRMVAEGKGDAFITAGSTGACITAATLIVKRVRGVRRAALTPMIPTAAGQCVLIDCGANAECTPEYLLQFAYMGSFYAKKALGIEKPRVGLLNNGAEDSKGLPLQKATHKLLTALHEQGKLNFVGNVEGRDVPLGACDVVVADGFSGNILLKTIEGTAKFMSSLMKEMFMKNAITKMGALCCKSGVADMKKLMDYRETGGTALLGITKPVIKAHGSSDALAIFSSVKQAVQAIEMNLAEEISLHMQDMTAPKEVSDL